LFLGHTVVPFLIFFWGGQIILTVKPHIIYCNCRLLKIMASRDGPRAEGSDGTDFQHRERIASHYETSAAYKQRLRYVIYLHLLLLALMAFRLSAGFCFLFNMQPPSVLRELEIPPAQMWEFVWLMTGIASLFGLIALRRNRAFLVQQYLIGTVVFGLGPVFFGIFSMIDDLLEYWDTRETKTTFFGFPAVLLWNMFFVIALQLHVCGLWFAWTLMGAWKSHGLRKKRQ